MSPFARALVASVLAALAVVVAVGPGTVAAATAPKNPKVVIIVGPVGDLTAHYESDANAIADEASQYTTNVVKIETPNATWGRVKAALQGANIVVYLGHGNGWPSRYTPWQPYTKDGLGLDPDTGADGTKHVYYGESYLAQDVRLAPNSVVLLYHLCYATGNTEPELPVGTFAQSKERVDNYGAGFLAAGARAVLGDGHPVHPATDYIRQLFTTRRTMDQLFHADPAYNGNVYGPYPSTRTPGLQYELDPDSGGATPTGMYRSLVGQLDLTTVQVTGARYVPTNEIPSDFVVPGAASVTTSGGGPVFATNEDADDPNGTPAATLAAASRVRLLVAGSPMADGTRVFSVRTIDGSVTGWMRASDLAPADSEATKVWSLDRPGALLSPNVAGTNAAMALGVRFSEPVPAKLTIRNGAGKVVKTISKTGDILRFDWDLTTSGALVPDGSYSWSLSAADGWGNTGVTATGAFTVDATDPTTTASVTGTAGDGGWLTSPASVTLAASDATSGVSRTTYTLDGSPSRTYSGRLAIAADGVHTLTYRSTDRAGNVEASATRIVRIDSVAPTPSIATSGTPGDVAGWFSTPVFAAVQAEDATSGVASVTYTVDGGSPRSGEGYVPVIADGEHRIVVTARDGAGNTATTSVTFRIDTKAPLLALATPLSSRSTPSSPRTVSPNGDGYAESVRLPFTSSEPATVTATVRSAAGAVVRTFSLNAAAGANVATWNGRDATGGAVPDGHYELSLDARDPAGNDGGPVAVAIDVYSGLTAVHRTATLFYPQDRDPLAAAAGIRFSLLRQANVSLEVVDASGAVVRTAFTNRSLAVGAHAWTWDGRGSDGSFVPQGSYRYVLTAGNGKIAERREIGVYVGAFDVRLSTATPRRGGSVTVTADTAEPLAGTVRVYVSQPGLAPWSASLSHVSGRTYRATIRLRRGGTTGTLRVWVVATDTKHGLNRSRPLSVGLA